MSEPSCLLIYLSQGVLKACLLPGEVFFTVPMVVATKKGMPMLFGNDALDAEKSWEVTWLLGGRAQQGLFGAFFKFVFLQPAVLNRVKECTNLLVAFEPVLIPSSNEKEEHLSMISFRSALPDAAMNVYSRSTGYLSLFGRRDIGIRYGLTIQGDYTRIRGCRNMNSISFNNVYVKVGFETIVNLFIKLLCEKGYDFTATKDRLFCNNLVLDYCYVALDFEKELERIENLDGPIHEIVMEDGTVLELGKECIIAPEVLFNPGLVGMDEDNIISLFHKVFFTGLLNFPPLLLSGRCAVSLDGLSERIQQEIMNYNSTDIQQLNIIKSNAQEDAIRWYKWLSNTD